MPQTWTVREFGNFQDVLRLEKLSAPPDHEPDSVLLRVHAAGVNFADSLLIGGHYQVRPTLPFVPGFESAGEVVEVPDGVTGVAVGERVMWVGETGAFGELQRVSPSNLLAIPPAMDYGVAAAFPIIYHTAYSALVHRAGIEAGETLLVHAGAGGVGSAAIQLGRALGATVIATAGGAEKVGLCRRLGAHEAVDYRRDDFVAVVKELTGGRGADVIFDPVGGDVFDRSTRCVAWEGRIVPLGFASGRIPTLGMNRVLVKNIAVLGLYWTTYLEKKPDLVRIAHDALLKLYEEEKVRPLIFERYPMADLPRALDGVVSRRSYGKSVLLMDD